MDPFDDHSLVLLAHIAAKEILDILSSDTKLTICGLSSPFMDLPEVGF
jgi:hypothetical protein